MINDRGRTASLFPLSSPHLPPSLWAWTSSLSCFINLIQAAECTFGKISRLITSVSLELWKISLLSVEKREQCFFFHFRSVQTATLTPHYSPVRSLSCSAHSEGHQVRSVLPLALWISHPITSFIIKFLCCRPSFNKIRYITTSYIFLCYNKCLCGNRCDCQAEGTLTSHEGTPSFCGFYSFRSATFFVKGIKRTRKNFLI